MNFKKTATLNKILYSTVKHQIDCTHLGSLNKKLVFLVRYLVKVGQIDVE